MTNPVPVTSAVAFSKLTAEQQEFVIETMSSASAEDLEVYIVWFERTVFRVSGAARV